MRCKTSCNGYMRMVGYAGAWKTVISYILINGFERCGKLLKRFMILHPGIYGFRRRKATVIIQHHRKSFLSGYYFIQPFNKCLFHVLSCQEVGYRNMRQRFFGNTYFVSGREYFFFLFYLVKDFLVRMYNQQVLIKLWNSKV